MGPLRPSGQECGGKSASPPWVLPAIWGLGIHRQRSRDLGCMGRRCSEARSMMPVEKVLEVVDRYEERHNGFWCICPAHDDHDPSLHVEEGEDGQALVICRAGCDQERVLDALQARGLKSADLFPNDPRASTRPKAVRSAHKGREQLAKSYDIKDVSGVLHGIHERWENPETPDQKSFKWKLPNGKYSKGDINPAAMPLYNSELVASWPEE